MRKLLLILILTALILPLWAAPAAQAQVVEKQPINTSVLTQAVFDKIAGDKKPIIKEEDGKYVMRELPYYHCIAENNVADGITYESENQQLSIKPVRIEYNDGTPFKAQPNETYAVKPSSFTDLGMLVEGRPGVNAVGVWYPNAFGNGNHIGVLTHKYKMKEIESITSMPIFPKDAETLDIWFEISGDLLLDWDYKTNYHITEPVQLGENSQLRPAYAWDSYTETIKDIDGRVQYLENRIPIDSYFTVQDGRYYYVKSLPIEWLSKAHYPIYTDADVSWGAESAYINTATNTPKACKVDGQTNRFVVIYPDTGAGDVLYIRAATITSFSTIVWGPQTQVTGVLHSYGMHSIGSINTDKIAVSYTKGSDDDGWTKVGTIDWGTADGTFTFGAEIEFGALDAEYQTISKLDTDKYLILYNSEGHGDRMYGCVASVAGTTVTLGAETQLDATGYRATNLDSVQIATDKVIAGFYAAGTNSNGYIFVVSVTGTVPAAGAFVDQGENKTEHHFASPFRDFGDADRAVAGWVEFQASPNATGEGMVITVSGTTQTWGPINESIHAGNTGYISVAMTSADNALFAFADKVDSDKMKSKYSDINWTTRVISEYSEEEAASDHFAYCDLDYLGASGTVTRVVISARNMTASDGVVIPGNAPYVTPGFDPPEVTTVSITNVGTSSALGTGNITAINGGTPVELGFCYTPCASGTPDYSNSLESAVWVSGTGTYSLTIDSLSCGACYNARAYAATTSGTGYGSVISFTTVPGAGCYTTDVLWIQYETTQISSGTISDQSSEGNDLIYTLEPNEGTPTITISSIYPNHVAAYDPPEVDDGWYLVGTGPAAPPDNYMPGTKAAAYYGSGTEAAAFDQLPGMSAMNELLQASQVPLSLFWLPLIAGIAIVLGFAIYKLTRHLLGLAVASSCVLFFCAAIGILEWWVIPFYLIFCGGLLIKAESYQSF